ncbi:MAG TPA: hypothetical protein VIS06_11205 [Mycobacteriales bacterium]
MSELRDPDRPDLADRPDQPDLPDLDVGRRERPRLRDLYADDDWDIFPGANGSSDARTEHVTDAAGQDRHGDEDRRDNPDRHDEAIQDNETYDGTRDSTQGDARNDGTGDSADSPEDGLSKLEAEHPEVGSVVRRLADDTAHRLDLTAALRDPRRRADTLAVIGELAEGRLLPDGDLERYRQESPGRGRLFTEVPPEVNHNADGTSRKDTYLARCEAADPARRVGSLPDVRQQDAVGEYAARLANTVEPLVAGEVEDLAADLPGATVSTRTKMDREILDKVGRMSSGSDSRPPREDYRVGHVVDAVGARITATDTDQLGRLLDRVCETLGVGDGGRVLELDNMYAAPKASNPSYRVIPLLVAVEADGIPYTYELQLTTRRASAAADLEHNTIYKAHVPTSDGQRDAVRRMMAEAAALDQQETRDPAENATGDGTRRMR